MNNTSLPETESFLTDDQLEGQANAKQREEVAYLSLDDAIARVSQIRNEEAVELFSSTEHEAWPTSALCIYCHDCYAIVPAGVGQTLRGNPRTVCGTCASKKISSGSEKGLVGFYHLDKETLAKPAPVRRNRRPVAAKPEGDAKPKKYGKKTRQPRRKR